MSLAIIENAKHFLAKTAIIDQNSEHSYEKLYILSQKMAQILMQKSQDVKESRIAFLCPPSFEYVMTQ